MNDIKPIETIYNGYRFRSRLEARWAVFFDAAGIEYEYEPEGFDLGNGVYYLPDFYLPEFNLWVEVKRNREADDGKAEQFAKWMDLELGAVLVCYSDPLKEDLRIITNWESNDSSGGYYDSDDGEPGHVRFVDCRHLVSNSFTPMGFDLTYPNYPRELFLFVDDDFKLDRSFGYVERIYTAGEISQYSHSKYGKQNMLRLRTRSIHDAEMKARQARFEHGEKP